MPTAAYFDPDHERSIERSVDSDPDLEDVIDCVLRLSSGRGHPAVDLVRDDGSCLSVATDGLRALLVWTNPIGETFHPTGTTTDEGERLVFDYFGSWSEAAARDLVPLRDGIESARQFLRTGVPDTQSVIFRPE